MPPKTFHEIGTQSGNIDVRVSYRIIQLFSEGLYSSPNKAIEELVSNAWDAGATHTHVILPDDRTRTDAKIVVIDDGSGMDAQTLRQHWLLGESNKRDADTRHPRRRNPIGRFGIGKLATYVLAKRLTHISKVNGKYYSTSMDYRRIDKGATKANRERVVKLPLRKLTETQAKDAVSEWTNDKSAAAKAIRLFGRGAAKNWTVAIMSDLKDMAQDLSEARLRWILETAMPLSDEFELYLNGSEIVSSKESAPKVGTWVLGKDLGTSKIPLPRPAATRIKAVENESETKDSLRRFEIVHPKLRRIWGYIEGFVDELKGKSDEWGQSNGFFVYVRGRRVNVDDAGFGIDRNKLQHGTFSRFRMVIHIDSLDAELRSSRESLRSGELLQSAREVLIAGFNFVRNRLAEFDAKGTVGAALALRVAHSPASLTVRPIVGLIGQALAGNASPRYLEVPKKLPQVEQDSLLAIYDTENDDFILVNEVHLSALSIQDGIAKFDVVTRVLRINTMHPFVAHFLNEFESVTRSLPLELFAMSEVLLEAHLYQTLDDESDIADVLDRRDQLFRHLARTSGNKTAHHVAQDLEEAARDKNALERELVNAFISLGFEAVPIGGSGKPDGKATAHLSGGPGGVQQSYSISLEAKSKEEGTGKVSAKTVGVAGIVRHRDNFDCDHAIVVGPDFPAANAGLSALEQEIDTANGSSDKTITLIKVSDLARLVRIQPQKRIGLGKLRELFRTCKTPDQAAAWIDARELDVVQEPPYLDILEAIYAVQKGEPDARVEYGKLRTALRLTKEIDYRESELKEICLAMMRLGGSGFIFANDAAVELNQQPSKVLSVIRAISTKPAESKKKAA